jgi:hypothetical protein
VSMRGVDSWGGNRQGTPARLLGVSEFSVNSDDALKRPDVPGAVGFGIRGGGGGRHTFLLAWAGAELICRQTLGNFESAGVELVIGSGFLN